MRNRILGALVLVVGIAYLVATVIACMSGLSGWTDSRADIAFLLLFGSGYLGYVIASGPSSESEWASECEFVTPALVYSVALLAAPPLGAGAVLLFGHPLYVFIILSIGILVSGLHVRDRERKIWGSLD